MDWLRSLYPEVSRVLESAIPDYWPELKSVFGSAFDEPFRSVAMLPLAVCQAVGGSSGDAIHVSAAVVAAEFCLRILDDLADRDRPDRLWAHVGPARAWNYATALHTLAFRILATSPYPTHLIQRINQLFIDAFFCIAMGQDRDLSGVPKTVGEYWSTIELKTGIAYSATCGAGAMVGTQDVALIEACGEFGHHLGLGIQVFNDMESIWRPDGATDLQQGKVTLPLMYGLEMNHPARDELARLVKSSQLAAKAERVGQILDEIDTRAFLVWAALKERDQALQALSGCPNTEGKERLESFVTGMFGDIDTLLSQPPQFQSGAY